MERLDDNEVGPKGSSAGFAARATDDGELTTPEPTVNELKAEISQTQGQLHQTLSEIQERLSPAHIAEQARNTVRDATVGKVTDMAEQAGQTASRMIEQTRRAAAGLPRPVRNNPWPLALIGVGVAWFLMNSARDDADEWRRDDEMGDESGGNDRRQHEYSEYSEYRGRTTKPVSAAAADVTARVGDMASDVSRRARDLSRTTHNRLGQTMRDNPIAVGAVALAAGALIGTLMPRTEVEDTYMGETRDTVVDSAREIAEDKVQELSNIVRDSSGPNADSLQSSLSSSP